MVTCARLAPACINLSPMAPPINTDLTTTTPTPTTSIISTKTTITTTTTVPIRPKLAFSIDALVGDNNEKKGEITQQCSFSISTAISPIQRSESITNNNNEPLCDVVGNSPTPSSECCPSCSSIDIQDTTSPDKPSTLISQVPQNLPKCPIRPLPMQLMTNALPQNMPPNFAHSMAPASSTETTMSTGVAPPHTAQPHFLTAQFQMAAALAHQHQQQQQHQQHLSNIHLPPGHPMTLFPHMSGNPHSHMLSAPPFIRDSYPLYPWFLNRHGRIFPHRFPGSKFNSILPHYCNYHHFKTVAKVFISCDACELRVTPTVS